MSNIDQIAAEAARKICDFILRNPDWAIGEEYAQALTPYIKTAIEKAIEIANWTDEGEPPRAAQASKEYPEPTPEDLENPVFEAIWQAIKGWDISRYNDGTYSGPTGNDVMHILNKIHEPPTLPTPQASEPSKP